VFFVLAGLGRDTTAGAGTVVTRYVYVAIAILVPLIAKVLGSATTWTAGRGAVVGLLAVTALGNVGQAEAYVPGHAAVTTGLKDELVATAHLLAAGVADVSGPGASPIGLYPDLSVASIEGLHRAGFLPATAPGAADLANARALLALGTWSGSKTALSPGPLFPGRFAFVRAVDGATSVEGNGCLDFGPETISPRCRCGSGAARAEGGFGEVERGAGGTGRGQLRGGVVVTSRRPGIDQPRPGARARQRLRLPERQRARHRGDHPLGRGRALTGVRPR